MATRQRVSLMWNGNITHVRRALSTATGKCVSCNRNMASSSAIAERPRCGVSKLWQKYKSEQRASNIALSYGVGVDK